MLTFSSALFGCSLSVTCCLLTSAPSLPTPPDETATATDAVPKQADAESSDTDQDQKWLLRYALQKDLVLRYEMQQTAQMDATFGPATKTDKTSMKQVQRYTVTDMKEDGYARISLQYESLWMQLQSGDKPSIEFDSSMPADEVPPPFRQAATQLKGSSPYILVNDRGETLRDPSGQTGSAKKSDETQAPSSLFLLPKEPVGVGDRWTQQISVRVRVSEKLKRSIPLLRSYELVSVEDDVALVRFATSIDTPYTTALIRGQLAQATPRGTFRFRISDGVLLGRDLQINQTVLNAMGNQTSLTTVSRTTETLLSVNGQETKVAAAGN